MDPIYTAYLEGELKLDKHGKWFHNGAPFQNNNLIELFNRSITWDDSQNKYFLNIGKGRASFLVEDTAYFVLELLDEEVPCQVRLSDRSQEELILNQIEIGAENQIYCYVKNGHRARFSRSAHQALLKHASGPREIKLNGTVFPLIPILITSNL
ncbi:MAG: DUF1285 domain-containing protein [Bdellovibrionales bacterium]|nr:DUF1285 domain-containing protein [Bdellovibrionales bacterium]